MDISHVEMAQGSCAGAAPVMPVPMGTVPADEAASNSHRSSGGGSSARQSREREQAAPVHIRLYQEKDDRRRRLEEARIRRLTQEEEDLRSSAQRAMGWAPSPGRGASPEPSLVMQPGRNGAATPPRIRPPLPERHPPERSASSSSFGTVHSGRRISAGPGGGGGALVGRRPQQPSSGHNGHGGGGSSGGGGPAGQYREEAYAQSATAPSSAAAQVVAHVADAQGFDISSAASEFGANGLQSVPSVSVLGAEDSTCAETANPLNLSCEDSHSLKQLVQSQQQRIEFLETMHQQALRQVRRSREELSIAQQQRFREADKVLGLEQLISEMQVARFHADPQMQLRWEEWMQRSRAILEAE